MRLARAQAPKPGIGPRPSTPNPRLSRPKLSHINDGGNYSFVSKALVRETQEIPAGGGAKDPGVEKGKDLGLNRDRFPLY